MRSCNTRIPESNIGKGLVYKYSNTECFLSQSQDVDRVHPGGNLTRFSFVNNIECDLSFTQENAGLGLNLNYTEVIFIAFY